MADRERPLKVLTVHRFLLAQIYLRLLDDKMTTNDIRSALKDFRKQDRGSGECQKVQVLTEAYTQSMERISGQKPGLKKLAMGVLSWITCANRPLKSIELQQALAIKAGKSELDKGDLPHIKDMVSVCAGLVTVDEESKIIRLVHYTTQEYFEQTQTHWFPNIETDITTTCITYLSFNVFERGFCQTDEEFEEQSQSNLFFNYAARNWGRHAHKASSLNQVLSQAVISFVISKAKVDASSQWLLAIKRYSSQTGYSQEVPRRMTGLHLIVYFGVKSNSKNSDGQMPLSYAAGSGHEALVKLMLDTGKVEADSKNGYGRTPLWYAAGSGHEATVKLLLDTGKVEADSKGSGGWTPLSYAAQKGQEAIVKLLLNTGKVEADSKSRDGRTPLSYAAGSGHEAIIKSLLDTGKVGADSKDSCSQTPLLHAAWNGHEALVKLLLDTGKVDADSKDDEGRTPLFYAARHGHEATVKLLLETGKVDADSQSNDGRTPQSEAAHHGHAVVVKLLLDTCKVDADS